MNALLESGKFDVTIFTRKDSTKTFPQGAKVVKTDYSDSELEGKFKGQDAVISLVAAPGIPDQKRYVDAAVKAGVKRFLPSEFGSNTLNKDAVKAIPLFGGKADVLNHLRSKAAGKFSYTALFTGPFFDWVRLRYLRHA